MDLIASPTQNGWAKADNFEADFIVIQFEKIKLISNCKNIENQIQPKNYPSKILSQTKIKLNQEKQFLSTERKLLIYTITYTARFWILLYIKNGA